MSTKVYKAHEEYLAGEYEVALESVSRDDAYASSCIVRAEILLAIGEVEPALEAVKQGLEFCPNSPRGILLLESIGRLLTPRRAPTLAELFDDELPVLEPATISLPAKPDDPPVVVPGTDAPATEGEDAPGLVSETLAKLMVAQGKFAEARKVYIQLSRKHPERYAYFRRQMDELVEREKTR